MESTRALGYSLEAAVADLLDNSVSAGATEIKIQFWALDDPYMFFLDNGHGMSSDDATNAMQYGSKSPLETRAVNDMGRFGLGLKTASLSQCRNLTVVTCKDSIYSARQWDLDIINERKKWILLDLDMDQMETLPGFAELRKIESGTLVVWKNFDRLSAGTVSFERTLGRKMDDVRTHVSLVFHRYLSGEPGLKKVVISINNSPIQPTDPFLVGRSEQIMDAEPIVIEGHRLSALPYILPHVSRLTKDELQSLGGEEGMRRKQGFYVYRNRRLLVWGTWFRLLHQAELYKLARVRVDIPNALDYLWNLDIRKSTAVPPEVVRRNLERIVKRIADGSKRTWTFRGKKETRDEVGHTWERHKLREGISYTINRDHPLVSAVRKRVGKLHDKDLERLLRLIEEGLPLNAMFVDMTEDEHFASESDTEANVRDLALSVLDSLDLSQEELGEKIAWMKRYEPFSSMPNVMEQLRKEMLHNDQ